MSFIHLILKWYQTNKRDLPWRNHRNPYYIWLSEVILQQTRVSQGMAYYLKFLEKYPTVYHLAKANEQEVLNLWQGLGYYSRARNLHKAAQVIVNDFDGEFPANFKELKKLPGIGNYTAAAIASICFEEKVPAIDGNAYRVYSRVFGLEKDISDSNAWKFYFDFAKEIMPNNHVGDYNQAIMELGATVCLPKSPLCMFCPVQIKCVAFDTGKVDILPVKTKKVKVTKKFIHYYFIKYDTRFLVNKREGKGVWQNMYDFPKEELVNEKSKPKKFDKFHTTLIREVKHILTHQQLFISFYKVEVDEQEFLKLSQDYQAISSVDVPNYPFPKPIADFLDDYI